MTQVFSGLTNAASPASRACAGSPVADGTLDNGMQVVVIPTRRSPAVRHMVWYRDGASSDPIGKSGLAHLLEHLMFKGTERHPGGQFGQFLSATGGYENAFTGWSYTSYYQHAPAEHLRACMDYEADRMRNLILSSSRIAQERSIVLAERSTTVEADPNRLLAESMHAAAFPVQSCGRPIIGWRHEIEALELSDVRAFYDQFYRPGNALLLVVGDAEPDAVMDMAARAYGPLEASKRGAEAVPRPVQDPPARVRQRVTMASAAVRQPHLSRLHLVPSSRTAMRADTEAFELLAHLLAFGRTSILHRRLVVDTELATTVGADFWKTTFRDRTLFSLAGTPAAGISLDQLEAGFDSVITDLTMTGVPRSELDRAKRQIVSQAIFGQDDPMTRALRYGEALCCGETLDDIALWRERIEGVTVEDLAGALAYLSPQTAVSGHLLDASTA